MNKINLLLFTMALVLGYLLITKPAPISRAAFEHLELRLNTQDSKPASNTICHSRPNCVVVYLAPWCPACRQCLDRVHEMRNYWSTKQAPEIVAIVGAGTPEQNLMMADELGGTVYIDKEDRFKEMAGVKHFPYFLVIEGGEKVVARGDKARSWVDAKIAEQL